MWFESLPAVLALVILVAAAGPSEAGQTTFIAPVAFLHHPVNVSYTSHGVILSYRINDSATVLATLEPNGTIRPFEAKFAGVQEVYVAEANGSAGFRAGDLFLCSGDTIYRIGSDGAAATFAVPSSGSTVEYLSFDATGSWGHLLYALTGDGGVWAVNSSGGAALVTNLGANLMPEGVAVAPHSLGAYAGDLLVTMENSHSIVAIPKNATDSPVTLAEFPNEAPERVLVVGQGDLLVAKYDEGSISIAPAGVLAQYYGDVLVITEGENGQTGSMNILEASGTKVTNSTVFADPTSPHFEGAAFVPHGMVSPIETNTSTTAASSAVSTSGSASTGTESAPGSFSATVAVLAVAAGALTGAAVLLAYSRRKL